MEYVILIIVAAAIGYYVGKLTVEREEDDNV